MAAPEAAVQPSLQDSGRAGLRSGAGGGGGGGGVRLPLHSPRLQKRLQAPRMVSADVTRLLQSGRVKEVVDNICVQCALAAGHVSGWCCRCSQALVAAFRQDLLGPSGSTACWCPLRRLRAGAGDGGQGCEDGGAHLACWWAAGCVRRLQRPHPASHRGGTVWHRHRPPAVPPRGRCAHLSPSTLCLPNGALSTCWAYHFVQGGLVDRDNPSRKHAVVKGFCQGAHRTQ